MHDFGYTKRPDREAVRKQKDALAAIYDKLFELPEFRLFLASIATRAGMFSMSTGPRGEWHEGYAAALRDVVTRAMVNSTRGAAIMAKTLTDKRIKQENREETNDE